MFEKSISQIICSQSQDYSIWTLRPKNKIEDKLFYRFRVEDCVELHTLFGLGVAVITCFNIINFITTGKKEALISVIETAFVVVLVPILLLIHKRFKEKAGYAILALRFLITINIVLASYAQFKMIEKENDPINELHHLKNSCFYMR